MILVQLSGTPGGAALKALSLPLREGEGKMGMSGVSNLKARAALLMVGLLVTLLVLALSACGSGGSAQEEAKARPLPEDPKTLRPGEYRSEEFKPSFSFRVGKGWQHEPLETPDKLAILRPGDQGRR